MIAKTSSDRVSDIPFSLRYFIQINALCTNQYAINVPNFISIKMENIFCNPWMRDSINGTATIFQWSWFCHENRPLILVFFFFNNANSDGSRCYLSNAISNKTRNDNNSSVISGHAIDEQHNSSSLRKNLIRHTDTTDFHRLLNHLSDCSSAPT